MAARRKELPQAGVPEKPIPSAGNPENRVQIGSEMIEIKPTKLRYQRDLTANFYKAIAMYPLADIFGWDESVIGDGRSGDKAVMDWLIAATDRADLIQAHYDEITTETVEKILEIFRRVNHIDEKEEKIKNALRERAME